MARRALSTEEFVSNARAVHGDRYDYSGVIYTSSNCYVDLICRVHGHFRQRASNHVHLKQGCRTCADIERAELLSSPLHAQRCREGRDKARKARAVFGTGNTLTALPFWSKA